jgi:hypothetical protein
MSNWHIMLYPALLAYQIASKIFVGFLSFQLIHGLEVVLPIECEIPSLKIVIEILPNFFGLDMRLVHLEHIDEKRHDFATANEAHKKRVKSIYDNSMHPRIFYAGDLVLVYDQDKSVLGKTS